MCARTDITHLAYVNDLLLFAQADESSITWIEKCLVDFSAQDGLLPNLRKSNLYMVGINDRIASRLLEITGFQRRTFPFRYLNIPLMAEKLRTSNYNPLTESIMWRMASWSKQTLSYVGKLELVKMVLQGIEFFLLSILSVPCVVIDKIYAIFRSFVLSTKHSPISWVKMCLAKEGGYGLRDLKTWNSALLSKYLWNIQ